MLFEEKKQKYWQLMSDPMRQQGELAANLPDPNAAL